MEDSEFKVSILSPGPQVAYVGRGHLAIGEGVRRCRGWKGSPEKGHGAHSVVCDLTLKVFGKWDGQI